MNDARQVMAKANGQVS